MHIKRAEFIHIKRLQHIVWEPQPLDGHLAGWNVILGDNAAGKTTFLQALVMTLEPSIREAFGIDLSSFLQFGQTGGVLYTRRSDHSSGYIPIGHDRVIQYSVDSSPFDDLYRGAQFTSYGRVFSASFGPMRRFYGGRETLSKMFTERPSLSAHLSLFHDDVAFTHVIPWLKDLQLKAYEDTSNSPSFLDQLKAFLNQKGLLPHDVRFDKVTSKGVFFRDGDAQIQLDDLSDGYRSVLSMTLELIRQLQVFFGDNHAIFRTEEESISVDPSGVVLIDEVDAHLHPTWQQSIGFWLTRHFPNIQFIVTTHSPLVCQAAETGTIFKLPAPDDPTPAHFVEGENLLRLLRGDIADAYSTLAFGSVSTSPKAQDLSAELTQLSAKHFAQGTLSAKEFARMEELKHALPSPENLRSSIRSQHAVLQRLKKSVHHEEE